MIDLTGQRFGRLVAIECVGRDRFNATIWRCKCDCGNITDVRSNHLRRQQTLSCGCLLQENRKNGQKRTIKYRYSVPDGYKRCCTCKEVLPTDNFHVNSAQKDGLSRNCKACRHRYEQQNAAKKQEYDKKYRQQNAEKLLKYRQQNADRLRMYSREYQQQNAERVRNYQREYFRRYPEIALANQHKRRARIAGNGGIYTKADIERLYTEQAGKCAYCGCDISGGYTIDHIIPLSRGGSNWPDNLALACKSCNSSKSNKMLDEWLDR